MRRAAPSVSAVGPERPRGGRQGTVRRFYTTCEVAELLDVSTRSVRRFIETGELIAHWFGRSVRIADEDLRAFLARRRGA